MRSACPQTYHALRALPPQACAHAEPGLAPQVPEQVTSAAAGDGSPPPPRSGGAALSGSHQQLHWMVFELLWRDFFR